MITNSIEVGGARTEWIVDEEGWWSRFVGPFRLDVTPIGAWYAMTTVPKGIPYGTAVMTSRANENARDHRIAMRAADAWAASTLAAMARDEDIDLAAIIDRIRTIADEAFGPFPVQSGEEACAAIERGIFELRQRVQNAPGAIRLAGLASIADDLDAIAAGCDAEAKAELRGIATGMRAASVPDVAPVQAGVMTVGAALCDRSVVEWFADGEWQQYIPRGPAPWRGWCAPSDRGPGGWSPWQPRALAGTDYTAPCRLVPLATADADPATRGAL